MKIRQGFVSNSSTSSFVLFGIKLSETQVEEVYKAFLKSKGEKLVEPCECGLPDCESCGVGDCDCGVEEFLFDKFDGKNGIEVSRGLGETQSSEDFFVGLSPEKMKNEETLLQFKERVAAVLTKNGLPTEVKKVKFYADAGYPE